MKKTILTIATAALLLSCAQQVGDIDRVQHNIVEKDKLLWDADGNPVEWYFRQTVIDAPYASAYTFIGDMGHLERGVFDIQEKYLYFYRTYTFIEGEQVEPRPDVDMPLLKKDGTPVKKDGNPVYLFKSEPIAVFPIESHLDIIWEYNPNTGERTNVRVENTSDRLWWEREYMRVDWTTNLVENYEFTMGMLLDKVGFSLYTGDAAPPEDQPVFTDNYIDFVNYYILAAPTVMYEDWGEIPLCWFYPWYSGGIFECVTEKIKTRSAFLKVDPEREKKYHSKDYSDKEMERFGYFRTERQKYNENYGSTYSGVIRKINRFNIWEEYKLDESGKIDYKDMTPKPILFYLNENYPRDLVQAGLDVINGWAEPFNETVEFLTGKKPSDFGISNMLLLCENNLVEYEKAKADGLPVAETKTPCDVTNTPKRNGDLRYNFLYAVTDPTVVRLYGYGPSSADPLTGEIISAAAYNFVAAMKRGANKAASMIELLAGVKLYREITEADYIALKKYDRLEEIGWKTGYTNEQAQKLAESIVKPEVSEALALNGVEKSDINYAQARLNIIAKNPAYEAMLIDDDIKLLFKDPRVGVNHSNLTESQLENYSLRKWAHHGGFNQLMNYYRFLSSRCLYMEDFLDNALISLAKHYQRVYDDAMCSTFKNREDLYQMFDFSLFSDSNPCSTAKLIEQMRVYMKEVNQTNPYAYDKYIMSPLYTSTNDPVLAKGQKEVLALLNGIREQVVEEIYQKLFKAIAEHELGHTLGLRHNFEASTDALNFPQEYWDLRVTPENEPIGLWGKETDSQIHGGIRDFQYSSVMDYSVKFNVPWKGVGLYDKAAIKYGYGDIVEVFAENPDLGHFTFYFYADPTKEDPGNYTWIKERGEGLGKLLRKIHYTNYPKLFGGKDKIYDRINITKSELLGGEKCFKVGAPCADGKVCREFYEGKFCSTPYEPVPYRYCGDEYAGRTPTCDMWDEGVDPFEIVRNASENYENYWVWWGYWHQDDTYWITKYDNAVRRVFKQMQRQYQYWVLQMATYNKNNFWFKRFGKRWEADINGGLSGTLASAEAFNTLANTFGRPVVGWFGFNLIKGQYEPLDEINKDNYFKTFYLMEEAGARQMYSYWNYEGYLPKVVSAGAIYDRLAAFEMLTDPTVDFIGVDEENDVRKYLINFQSVFGDQLYDLFNGLIADKVDKYGWCMLFPTAPDAIGPTSLPVGFMKRVFVGNDQGCPKVYNGNTVYSLHLKPEQKYIFPTTRFRIPMLAAYYGMSLLMEDYNKTFMDATRIYLKGHKTEVTPIAGFDVVECEDPLSGKIYVAYKDPADDFSPAYELVSQCKEQWQAFLAEYEPEEQAKNYLFSDLQFLMGKIELLRGMHATYDYATK